MQVLASNVSFNHALALLPHISSPHAYSEYLRTLSDTSRAHFCPMLNRYAVMRIDPIASVKAQNTDYEEALTSGSYGVLQ